MKLIKTIILFLVVSPILLLCQFTGGSNDGYYRLQYSIPGADTTLNPEIFSWINDGYSKSRYSIPGADTTLNPEKFSWINDGYSRADFFLSNYLSTPTLLTPLNNSINQQISPILSWQCSSGGITYTLQVSTDSNFPTIIINQLGITDAHYQITGLNYNRQYFWRVNVTDGSQTSTWSEIWNFTTINEPIITPFSVKVLLQNFWNGTTQRVSAGIIELRQGEDFYSSTLVDRQHGLINSNGILNLSFTNLPSGLYWLVFRHGSHLPVVSADRINIVAGTPFNYDFSISQSQALNGTALIQLGNVWVVMNGDVDGNLNIDAIDYGPTRNNFGWGSEASEPEQQP